MNLRDLKYIVAVGDLLHFGRAAEACFVSQPTLSAQVKKLEDQLGVAIFERTNKSVAVTPVGEAILHHARAALEQADAIEREARARRDPLSGPLRLGVIPTLSPYLTPLIFKPLRDRFPELELALTEETTERLLERLDKHAIDAALIATTCDAADVRQQPLFDEPFWLAHPREHPLYGVSVITRRMLSELDVLVLADGHCLADQVREVCRFERSEVSGLRADLRAASLETLIQLVAAGLGVTLVPALALRGPWMTDAGVVIKPLEAGGAKRRIFLTYRASFPRTVALDALAQTIGDLLPNTVVSVDGGKHAGKRGGTKRSAKR